MIWTSADRPKPREDISPSAQWPHYHSDVPSLKTSTSYLSFPRSSSRAETTYRRPPSGYIWSFVPSSKFSYFLPRGLVVLPTFFFVRSPTTSAAAQEILSPRHAILWSGERRHRGFSPHSSISALFFMSFTPRYTPQPQPRCMRFQTGLRGLVLHRIVAHRQDPGQPALSLDGWRKCAIPSDNHITTGFEREGTGQELPIWSRI
ncbi:hypothetical protein B0H16DRAFT_182902 [Mycena metata]|uniref:Uncharacterized protein n=1 Tax=Mycena metata TaxID=1033252 RepID=A0AAD7I1I9_9AGAR|nr:hypothetical protein B0H16DRAFT_182902 [Mycena metata]